MNTYKFKNNILWVLFCLYLIIDWSEKNPVIVHYIWIEKESIIVLPIMTLDQKSWGLIMSALKINWLTNHYILSPILLNVY